MHTGLKIAVPPGTYGRVAPRSGLAVKHFIDTGAGVIDEDYRGELMVLLFNHADSEFQGEASRLVGQASPQLQPAVTLSCMQARPCPNAHNCMRSEHCQDSL